MRLHTILACCIPQHAQPAPRLPPQLCSGCIYKALFNDEVIAVKEIDIGGSLEVQGAFVTVGGAECLREGARGRQAAHREGRPGRQGTAAGGYRWLGLPAAPASWPPNCVRRAPPARHPPAHLPRCRRPSTCACCAIPMWSGFTASPWMAPRASCCWSSVKVGGHGGDDVQYDVQYDVQCDVQCDVQYDAPGDEPAALLWPTLLPRLHCRP